MKNGKMILTYVSWIELSFDANLVICLNVSGDSGDFEWQYGRFFPELSSSVFLPVLVFLQNLVDCPCLEHIVLIFVVY
jgi:hypothetical protein